MNNQLIETRFYNSPKGHTYQVNFYPQNHFEIIDPIEGTHNESDLFWMHAYYPEVMNDLIDEPLHTTSRDIQEDKWANEQYVHQYGEDAHSPDCPACLRHLSHSDNEHYDALRRVHEASVAEYQDETWGGFYEG